MYILEVVTLFGCRGVHIVPLDDVGSTCTREPSAQLDPPRLLGSRDPDTPEVYFPPRRYSVDDAFAIEELVCDELIGLSEVGDTEGLLERGAFGSGSRKRCGLAEVSFADGLIGRGRPGGATGVFELLETVAPFRESAEDRIGLCHMLGAGSVCFVQVLERVERLPR
jgi:hypothetical protein